jgi:hypothetical protein
VSPDEKAALLRQLNDELDRALRDYFEIQKELDRIVMEAPSGLPLPDGTQRVFNTGRAVRHAFHAYEQALKKLHDYLENGTVPYTDAAE